LKRTETEEGVMGRRGRGREDFFEGGFLGRRTDLERRMRRERE